MEGQSQEPSPALLVAQERLAQLRAAYQQARPQGVGVVPADARVEPAGQVGEHRLRLPLDGQAILLARRRQEAAVQPTPSDALRAYLPLCPPSPRLLALPPHGVPAEAAGPSQPSPGRPASLKVYPGILLGMLERGLEAAGRVWLLLQYLDERGSGWIPVEQARQQLTGQESQLRICSWRNLRGLLQRGEGIFWQRDNAGRIWLRGAGKVAAIVESGRLQGRPVELPLMALLGGVGGVRAHFYASFHSGRKNSNPISRAKLAKLTHVPARTQRTYERAAGVRSRPNLAVGEAYTKERMQERAWQHGRATFELADYRGHPDQSYIAWRLPNSYSGCHAQRPKGRQRKINRQIDLVNSVAQGNGRPVCRLFYRNGAAAGKAYNRDKSRDAYWQALRPGRARFRRWHLLPGKEA
jgi:hypothetical protein